MQMQKSLGFQQQHYYGNESQHQSYGSHEESWSSKNNHHNHFQSMNMKNNGAYAHGSSRHHDFGMFGGGNGHQHGMFPSMGGGYLHGHGHGYGHGHGHFSEESEYESHKEVHNGGGNMKMDEMRYERYNYGGRSADAFCANPHGRSNRMNSFRKAEWGVKGV